MKDRRSLLFVLAVLVGLLLASVGGYFLWGAYVCSSTEMVYVESTAPDDNAVPFDSLSERQQEVFRRAVRNNPVRVDEGFEIPHTVTYEDRAYSVYLVHGDGCWTTIIPAAPVTLLGLALVGFGGRRLRSE